MSHSSPNEYNGTPHPKVTSQREVRMRRNKMLCSQGMSVEKAFIRRWLINPSNRCFIEPQVDGQLPTVLRQIAEYCIADHDVPRIFVHQVTAGDELPRPH